MMNSLVNLIFKRSSYLVGLLGLIVSVYGSVAYAKQEQPITAELVWVEQHDKLFQVRFSLFADDEWSEPALLYQSENFLTSPAIGTNHSGAKLVIWTEQNKIKSVLKSIQRAPEGEWSAPRVFANQGSENFAATIVYDLNNIAWVFWASTRAELSDIYLSKSSGVGWTKSELIHSNNQVPDILPVASLNPNGDVMVSWTKYSFSSQSYITADKVFSNQQHDQAKQQSLIDAVRSEQISLPTFVPDKRLVVLHFPTNSMIQSRPLSID